MNEEGVTYAGLKLSCPKQQRKRRPTNKRREFPWQVIAIILGVICLLLLLVITVLGYKVFQSSPVHKTQDMKNTPEAEGHSNHSASPPYTDKGYNTYQEKWSCCKKKCYYFSKEEKTWNESKKSCEDLGSQLVKTDGKEEQSLIQSKIKYSYWSGLHRKGAQHTWMWLDGSTISQELNFRQTSSDAECGHIKAVDIVSAVCTKQLRFICEKKFSCLNN